MRDIVTWESIVGKDFLDTFTQIATAEYWSGVKELPIKTAYDRYSDKDIETYHDKRSLMRYHGWRQAYLTKKGTLKFMVIYDPKDANYITLSEHIGKRQADELAAYADEWDAGQTVKETTRAIGKKTYRVQHDKEFVPEEATP